MRRGAIAPFVALSSFVLLAGSLQGAHPVLAAGDGVDIQAVDDFLRGEMSALHIPGLAVAIVQGQQIVQMRGFGVADSTGRAVTAQTPFVLASTTKELTALAVMQLVEAGKLELDSPVRSYIPWFATADFDLSGRITVRELLNMTSGLSTLSGRLDEAGSDSGRGALERAVRRLSSQPLASAPGREFHYSNSDYVVLGMLVQAVSAEPYGVYMQSHVFMPLDMGHTHSDASEAMQDGLAEGSYPWFGFIPVATRYPFSAQVPAEGIISSAEDMAHVLVMNLNDGSYGSQTLISPAGLELIHTGVADEGGGYRYAMGWAVHPLYGDPAPDLAANRFTLPLVLDHTGDAANYHSVIALLPGLKRGAVLLMNSNDEISGAGYFRLQVGIEQILARMPVYPADYFSDNPLRQFGRQIYFALLAIESLWIALWVWTMRRGHRSDNRKLIRIRPAATVLGLFLFISAVGFLWFVLPGMFDITATVLIRLFPDVATVGIALTALTAAWTALRATLVARSILQRIGRSQT